MDREVWFMAKPVFLDNDNNIKDAHGHDANFYSPESSPSFIWRSPFVKKRKRGKVPKSDQSLVTHHK